MTPWEQYLQSLYLERASGMPRWNLTAGDQPEGLRRSTTPAPVVAYDDSELTGRRRLLALEKAVNEYAHSKESAA